MDKQEKNELNSRNVLRLTRMVAMDNVYLSNMNRIWNKDLFDDKNLESPKDYMAHHQANVDNSFFNDIVTSQIHDRDAVSDTHDQQLPEIFKKKIRFLSDDDFISHIDKRRLKKQDKAKLQKEGSANNLDEVKSAQQDDADLQKAVMADLSAWGIDADSFAAESEPEPVKATPAPPMQYKLQNKPQTEPVDDVMDMVSVDQLLQNFETQAKAELTQTQIDDIIETEQSEMLETPKFSELENTEPKTRIDKIFNAKSADDEQARQENYERIEPERVLTGLINETHEQNLYEPQDTRSPENKAHHENLFSEIKHLLNIDENDSQQDDCADDSAQPPAVQAKGPEIKEQKKIIEKHLSDIKEMQKKPEGIGKLTDSKVTEILSTAPENDTQKFASENVKMPMLDSKKLADHLTEKLRSNLQNINRDDDYDAPILRSARAIDRDSKGNLLSDLHADDAGGLAKFSRKLPLMTKKNLPPLAKKIDSKFID